MLYFSYYIIWFFLNQTREFSEQIRKLPLADLLVYSHHPLVDTSTKLRATAVFTPDLKQKSPFRSLIIKLRELWLANNMHYNP